VLREPQNFVRLSQSKKVLDTPVIKGYTNIQIQVMKISFVLHEKGTEQGRALQIWNLTSVQQDILPA